MAYTAIDDSSAHFQAMLYTGNGGTLAVTNDGNSDLQPDFVWAKNRDRDGYHHNLYDSTRGVLKQLYSNLDNAESSQAGSLTAFNSDGFTLGSDDSSNYNGDDYVAWQWKANGGTTSSNTSGTITSTVQANTTAGFSILTYAGQDSDGTVGHGLGAEPHLIIIKNTGAAYSWHLYWKVLGNQGLNWLESTAASSSSAGTWSETTATSTLFSLGGEFNGTSKASNNYVAYCFAPIQGFSKIGSYTGNGNADGPFIYTGFKPRWLMYRYSNAVDNWVVKDSARDTSNPIVNAQIINSSDDDNTYSGHLMDFLSNGFKLRGTDPGTNTDGGNFIYVAFAEQPFVTSGGVPCTAR